MKDKKREVVDAARFISKSNLVAGTWGNVSVRDENFVYITPSGVPYDSLDTEDIVVVDLNNGEKLEGRYKPSTELPIHIEIYKSFPDIYAVVHFHSIYATAFAVLRRPIPCYVEDQAQILGGVVRVAEYALPGTTELAKNVVDALKGRFGVLLANHGALTVGRTMKEALVAAQILEKSAQVALLVRDGGVELLPEDIAFMRENYIKSYSKKLLERGE